MTVRSAVAGLLEGIAASLRASVALDTTVGDAADLTTAGTRPSPGRVDAFPHPVGFWLCTVSTFDDFLVGHAYPAIRDGSSVRVHPYPNSSWAPYWQSDEGRFCYQSSMLDFVYLGATLPSGHPVDTRSREQRIQDRFERRDAA